MLRTAKAIVRDFYESFGWSTDTAGAYKDTTAFVDLRPVLSSYPSLHADAGQRRKLGTHGLYVVGDLANLPIREGPFDAVLASHVLYHLPADEQASAVRELYRTLKGGGTCVIIIYIWPAPLITKLRARFTRALHAIAPDASRPRSDRSLALSPARAPPLYFHPRDYDWVRHTLPKDWNTDVRVWRAVVIVFTRTLITDNFLRKFPTRIGQVGQVSDHSDPEGGGQVTGDPWPRFCRHSLEHRPAVSSEARFEKRQEPREQRLEGHCLAR